MPETKREYGALSWSGTAIAIFVVLTVVVIVVLLLVLALVGFAIS